MSYQIHTDGSASPNPGQGGCAAIVIDPTGTQHTHSQAYAHTTNNRMEIQAAILGLQNTPPCVDVEVFSDSNYLINTMNSGWTRRTNRDLWDDLDALIKTKTSVTFTKVKAHASDPLNIQADNLANTARTSGPWI